MNNLYFSHAIQCSVYKILVFSWLGLFLFLKFLQALTRASGRPHGVSVEIRKKEQLHKQMDGAINGGLVCIQKVTLSLGSLSPCQGRQLVRGAQAGFHQHSYLVKLWHSCPVKHLPTYMWWPCP